MMELRLRTRVSALELDAKKGKMLTDGDYNVLLTGRVRVLQPDGRPLCVYLPGVLAGVIDEAWPTLSAIRVDSRNRGMAAGQLRTRIGGGGRSVTKSIKSAVLGGIDPAGPQQYCRLTAFTAREAEKFEELIPIFQAAADRFSENVPERYAAQIAYSERTQPDWVIPGTPFTTITVNNTYPTGVHTDKGDLDEGFSCLAAARRGAWRGGRLTFPEYRVSVDMQHGDLLLMDAHQWHGNTPIICDYCAASLDKPGHRCDEMPPDADEPERVSLVLYYRTGMVKCGSLVEENEKRGEVRERLNRARLGL